MQDRGPKPPNTAHKAQCARAPRTRSPQSPAAGPQPATQGDGKTRGQPAPPVPRIQGPAPPSPQYSKFGISRIGSALGLLIREDLMANQVPEIPRFEVDKLFQTGPQPARQGGTISRPARAPEPQGPEAWPPKPQDLRSVSVPNKAHGQGHRPSTSEASQPAPLNLLLLLLSAPPLGRCKQQADPNFEPLGPGWTWEELPWVGGHQGPPGRGYHSYSPIVRLHTRTASAHKMVGVL